MTLTCVSFKQMFSLFTIFRNIEFNFSIKIALCFRLLKLHFFQLIIFHLCFWSILNTEHHENQKNYQRNKTNPTINIINQSNAYVNNHNFYVLPPIICVSVFFKNNKFYINKYIKKI